jgi:hypothetical protein
MRFAYASYLPYMYDQTVSTIDELGARVCTG